MTPEHEDLLTNRRDERGAALITALLVSLLMLAAGGALIYTTGMTVANATDATAEAQAYYAAEAGLQSAVTVLRGNVAPKVALGLPVGTKVKNNFRVLNLLTTSNLPTDKATYARLSGWLPYNGNEITSRVPLGNNTFFQLSISDPDDPNRTSLLASATYVPTRLLITSTGYGPKGSLKRMQLMVRPASDIEVPGGVTLRGKTAGGTGTMTFDLGTSNGRGFLTDGSKPVFVTTNAGDETTVTNFAASDDKSKVIYNTPTTGDTATGTAMLPNFLTDPAATEQVITDLKALDTPDDNIKIVEGDYNATKDDTGGILLVTGTLTLGGSNNFTGIILVLGEGKVVWKGQCDVTGAMFVVKYDRTKLKEFDAPTFDVSGAGSSTITYSGSAAQNALTSLGFRVAGMVEQ
jgi:hypothetical protein